MRRLWIDEDLQVGQILYQPTPDLDGTNSWVRVEGRRTPIGHDSMGEYRGAVIYELRLLTHNHTLQHADLAKIRQSGLMLWEPPPEMGDVAALERWLALDQPSPPTVGPGTP